jgi:L,D-transpeptidase YcbB
MHGGFRLSRVLAGTAIALLLPGNLSGARAEEQVKQFGNMPIERADTTLLPDMLPAPPGAEEEPKSPFAADLSPADLAVAQKLQEMLANVSGRSFERKQERAAVEAFYAGRGYAPLWIANGVAAKRTQQVIARLNAADSDGLDPADYPRPEFSSAKDRPDGLAEAELQLTKSVLTYARHAQTGRVHYSRVSGDIAYRLAAAEPGEVLAAMASAPDAGDALGSYHPPHEGYRALRARLAELRSRKLEPAQLDGPTLKLGMRDPRVPQLRQRMGVALAGDDTAYDKALAEAVKDFQREHGLAASGQLNSATVEALKGRRSDRETDIILANMERWRWLPRELGKAYVMVNIPDYSLQVVRDDVTVWQTKIVVGKPSMPTPLLSEQMKFITVNPTWNVPPSIVQNEYLPALRQDPMALARIGLRIEHNRDGSIHVFQPPGERNALGRIRFNFPNKFLVYQHDTPDKRLFAENKRAYSHGCMRVQDPLKYAEVLLSIARPHDGYTMERLQRMFGRDEQDISFPAPIPVHLTYQTAFVDRAGKLQLREDVYGRDGPVLTAMRGDERKVADVPIERHESRTRPRQVVQLPQRPHPSRTAFSRGLEYQYNGWGSNNWGSNGWGSRYGSSGGAPFTWWR